MFGVIMRRLMIAVPTMLIIIAISFAIIKFAPGGPFDSDVDLDPEIRANLEAVYHLDKPIFTQFTIYAGKLFRGDLGESFVFLDRNVSDIIRQGFPVTATIGLLAMAIAILVGVALGTLAALRKNSAVDYSVMSVAMAGIAIPTFVTAPTMALVFGLYLGVLPISGWNGGNPANLVLPVIALALPKIGVISRITRGGMVEVLRANHVRTARSKGLPEHKVVWRHALRTGLTPLVSYLGPAIAGVMTGSVVIETVFSLPGIGLSFVTAAVNRDFPVIMGITILYAGFILFMNLLVDIAYHYLDPRVG